jgi:hypothetical protein
VPRRCLGILFAGIRDNRSLSFATVFGSPAMPYFAERPAMGRVLLRRLPRVISVLDSSERRCAVGVAAEVDRTHDGLAVWRLTVRGVDVPGRFVVIDGEFIQIGDTVESGR